MKAIFESPSLCITVFCVLSLFLLYTLLVKMHVFKMKHEHCLYKYIAHVPSIYRFDPTGTKTSNPFLLQQVRWDYGSCVNSTGPDDNFIYHRF